MWQRFTERARRVILLGQEEAGKMHSSHVGTEHLLLGLVREDEGVAAQVLKKLGVGMAQVREEIAAQIEPDSGFTPEPKLTPKAKRVLELAADEARRMRHNYIGTEHLLLALLREKDGLAAKVLRKLGLDLEKARNQVLEYLGPDAASTKDTFGSRRAAAEDALSPVASVIDDMDAPWAAPASDARRHQTEDAMLIEVLAQMQAHEERQALYDKMLLLLLRRMLTQSSTATTLLTECGLDVAAARERIEKLLGDEK